jgi:hypothetical protein
MSLNLKGSETATLIFSDNLGSYETAMTFPILYFLLYVDRTSCLSGWRSAEIEAIWVIDLNFNLFYEADTCNYVNHP